MAQYIDKDALVEEIVRRKEINKYRDTPDGLFEDEAILSFINTLEVKEVDLDKEINRIWNETSDSFTPNCWIEFENIAKHFFRLGLKAQKGE